MGVISAWSLRVRSGVGPMGVVSGCMVDLIASEASFLVCSMARIIYNYIYTCMFHAYVVP